MGRSDSDLRNTLGGRRYQSGHCSLPRGILLFQGRETYEVWNYEGRKTVLVFDEHELVAWSTSETVQELAAQR
jgi:hypothetical protein